MAETRVAIAGAAAVLDPAGRAVAAGEPHARRRRPASGEELVLRPARHVPAALRHRRDAGAAGAARRAARSARGSSASATAFTIAAASAGSPRPTARGSRRCSAGRDWIWVTGNHDPRAAGRDRRRHRGRASRCDGLRFRHEPLAGRGAGRGRRAPAPRREDPRPRPGGALPRLRHRRRCAWCCRPSAC